MKNGAFSALNKLAAKAWGRTWSRLAIIAMSGFLLVGSTIALSPFRIGVDLQRVLGYPSCLPSIVYLIDYRTPHPPRLGDYAVFLFPDTGYQVGPKEGQRAIKLVHALPGHSVKVDGTELLVRDFFEDRLWLAKSISGMGPGDWNASYKVEPGTFFAYGTEKESFDSRYFGPVDQRRIVGYARPLF